MWKITDCSYILQTLSNMFCLGAVIYAECLCWQTCSYTSKQCYCCIVCQFDSCCKIVHYVLHCRTLYFFKFLWISRYQKLGLHDLRHISCTLSAAGFAISMSSPEPNTLNSFQRFNPTFLCAIFVQHTSCVNKWM